jgi:DNA-binding LacI/PurR family transcriptional regulator
VSAALADTERNLVLLTARDRREQEKVGRYVMQGHVDGVVFMSLHREDVLPGILERTGVPVVLSGRPLDGRPAAYVDADNVGGGCAATEHLLTSGRRVVATVTGPADMVAGIDRHAGYLAAFEAAGRPLRPELVEAGDFTEGGGRRATEALLARAPDLDALFVASDPMAVGALAALRAAGRRVPDDVAVVGFDDAPVAKTCDPPLTTVAQPLPDMARLMTDLLVARIEGLAGPDDHHVVPTTLVRRAST